MRLLLAPLAGFTDAPFRLLCREGGADLCYTEMVSAAGLAHGSVPTWRLMETMPGEGPFAIQLFGAKESDLATAAALVDSAVASGRLARPVELNLNAGCPMTKVTREGAGAKLMESPAKIHALLKAMKENTSLPVTLKARLGPRPGEDTVFEAVDAAERAGASAVAIHARYTSQMHGGEVHLDLLAEVVSRSHVPVTGNGSIKDLESASKMASTGVDAIMVGRAALAEPSIFARLKDPSSPGALRSLAAARRHIELLLEYREFLARRDPNGRVPSVDALVSVKMHTHLFRYFAGLPGAAEMRRRLNSVRTLRETEEILHAAEEAASIPVA